MRKKIELNQTVGGLQYQTAKKLIRKLSRPKSLWLACNRGNTNKAVKQTVKQTKV